ncbi:hypothetical protein [uncultured Kordia sp.]|uniref:hypothetical protein n=1 Tax=uncultured Kordia sp. TaxID=507699 RepID=UPI00262A046B|nr:hypothetical protein [uncultured Kordia sp.]
MKKRNLKSLNIKKEKVSVLNNLTGGFGFTSFVGCHSNISLCLCSGSPICNGTPLQTDEGPCPGGTAGCENGTGTCQIP